MPGPPDRDVALAKLLCGVLDDILNPDLLFALVGPLPPPPHPLTIGGATPPWGKLPRDGWAISDIINQAVFCYFSFYFFAIFLDLHANILRDSARSYIASLLFLLCYFCYLWFRHGTFAASKSNTCGSTAICWEPRLSSRRSMSNVRSSKRNCTSNSEPATLRAISSNNQAVPQDKSSTPQGLSRPAKASFALLANTSGEKQRNDGYDQANTEPAWATTARLFAAGRRPLRRHSGDLGKAGRP